MTPELTVLALAGLLQAVQFVLQAVPATLELGAARTLAPRDDGDLTEHLSTRTARIARALNNHFDALVLFTLAVVVVTLGDASSGFTAVCAWVYLVARVLYIPAYAYGLVPWRSVVFGIGFTATMLMILVALF